MLETDVLPFTSVNDIGATVNRVTMSAQGGLVEDVYSGGNIYVVSGGAYADNVVVNGAFNNQGAVTIIPSNGSSVLGTTIELKNRGISLFLIFAILAIAAITGFLIYRLNKSRMENGKASIVLDYGKHPMAYVYMLLFVSIICKLAPIIKNGFYANILNVGSGSILLVVFMMVILKFAPKKPIFEVIACLGLGYLIPFCTLVKYYVTSFGYMLSTNCMDVVAFFGTAILLTVASIGYLKNKYPMLVKTCGLICVSLNLLAIAVNLLFLDEVMVFWTCLIQGLSESEYYFSCLVGALGSSSLYLAIALFYMRNKQTQSEESLNEEQPQNEDYVEKKPDRIDLKKEDDVEAKPKRKQIGLEKKERSSSRNGRNIL